MSQRPRVLLTQDIAPSAMAELGAFAQAVVAPDARPATLRELARDCDAIVVRAQLPDDLFEAAPRLRAAVRHGAGLDFIPLAQATAHGVAVANVPGANAQAVAEHVLQMMMNLGRRFRPLDARLRADGWAAARPLADGGSLLAGRSLGIVGYGNVGRRVAELARVFGMKVRIAQSLGDGAAAQPGRTPLDALFAASDTVVLCCPLTPATRGLVSAQRLAAMKPGAFLVNVARGPVVDQQALAAALAAGRLGGAALDVFAEHPLPAGDPLFALDNAILTPHCAGISHDSMAAMGEGAVHAVRALLGGQRPTSLVNPEAWPAFAARPVLLAPPAGAPSQPQ